MFVILLAETHDALDQLGAWRHLVGPKHHSFQPKVVTHSFCPENVENNYFRCSKHSFWYREYHFLAQLKLYIIRPPNEKSYAVYITDKENYNENYFSSFLLVFCTGKPTEN